MGSVFCCEGSDGFVRHEVWPNVLLSFELPTFVRDVGKILSDEAKSVFDIDFARW